MKTYTGTAEAIRRTEEFGVKKGEYTTYAQFENKDKSSYMILNKLTGQLEPIKDYSFRARFKIISFTTVIDFKDIENKIIWLERAKAITENRYKERLTGEGIALVLKHTSNKLTEQENDILLDKLI